MILRNRVILGSLLGGWPTDKFGRKKTLLFIGGLYVLSSIGCGFANSVAMFVVARFREELAGGAEVPRAVEATVARAGRSVFFSGLAVGIGILGLAVFPFPALRSTSMTFAIVRASGLSSITAFKRGPA